MIRLPLCACDTIAIEPNPLSLPVGARIQYNAIIAASSGITLRPSVYVRIVSPVKRPQWINECYLASFHRGGGPKWLI